MGSILLRNPNAVVSDEGFPGSSIVVADGKIASKSSLADKPKVDETVEAAGLTVYPGFVDVHNHGAVGVDVNEADVDGLLAIASYLASNGVTAWLPTLVPDSDENYRRTIDAIDQLMAVQVGKPVAQALGVHFEGVFASEMMCGALSPEFFKTLTVLEIEDA